MGLCVVATLLGAAAGPAVVFFVCFLYLAWRAGRVLLESWRELAVIAVAAIAVLVFLPVGQTLSDRATGKGPVASNSAEFRHKFNNASITIWELSPITGAGLGNDRYYNPLLVHFGSDFSPGQQTEFQSVNAYLGALSESGVFGLLALLAMVVALFLPLPRVRREGAWVTEVPILLFIVSFFFISTFVYPIFWFFAGARLAQVCHLEQVVESIFQPQAPRTELMTAEPAA
jgi:O-antigen ligase